MKKKCFKCGIEKPLTDYYKHKEMGDGHLNKCKECTKKDSTKHRADNLEKVRAYDRARGRTEERKQKNRDYKQRVLREDPQRWKEMRYKACKKYKEKNKEKYIATSRLRYAVTSGKIKKKNCEICGSSKSEAHHPDYSKPLKVIWLCDFHHKEEHKRLKEIKRNS